MKFLRFQFQVSNILTNCGDNCVRRGLLNKLKNQITHDFNCWVKYIDYPLCLLPERLRINPAVRLAIKTMVMRTRAVP